MSDPVRTSVTLVVQGIGNTNGLRGNICFACFRFSSFECGIRNAECGVNHARRKPKSKSQGDHGSCRANYRCCLPALAGFVSPQSMGPGNTESAAERALVQGETFACGIRSAEWSESNALPAHASQYYFLIATGQTSTLDVSARSWQAFPMIYTFQMPGLILFK